MIFFTKNLKVIFKRNEWYFIILNRWIKKKTKIIRISNNNLIFNSSFNSINSNEIQFKVQWNQIFTKKILFWFIVIFLNPINRIDRFFKLNLRLYNSETRIISRISKNEATFFYKFNQYFFMTSRYQCKCNNLRVYNNCKTYTKSITVHYKIHILALFSNKLVSK